MADPYNPYADAMALGSQRRQMLAQRLLQSQPAPPSPAGGPSFMSLSVGGGGGGGAPAGGGMLAGLDPKALAGGLKSAGGGLMDMLGLGGDPVKQQFAKTGEAQSGYETGTPSLIAGKRNSEGADVLQQMGLYNPLPEH